MRVDIYYERNWVSEQSCDAGLSEGRAAHVHQGPVSGLEREVMRSAGRLLRSNQKCQKPGLS